MLLEAVAHRMCRLEFSSSFNTFISMTLVKKQEKDQRRELICAKLKPGSHRGLFSSIDPGFAASVKS